MTIALLSAQIVRYLYRRFVAKQEREKAALPCAHPDFPLSHKLSATIVIPTRNKVELLRNCVASVTQLNPDIDIEILVVNNCSDEVETLTYLNASQKQGLFKVIDFPHRFNFSAICNKAVPFASKEYIVFLNNDTVLKTAGGLRRALGHFIDPDVEIVGSVLINQNGSIQSQGLGFGLKGIAAPIIDKGAFINSYCLQVDGVSFAFAAVRLSDFKQNHGLDESFPVGLNDVDFSLRVMMMGKKSIVCGQIVTEHIESASRRGTRVNVLGVLQATKDVIRFLKKWPDFFLPKKIND